MLRASVIRFSVLSLGLLGQSCGAGREAQQPTPSLSETPGAQADFRAIVQRWFELSESSLPALSPMLQRFVARYPHEPRVANVHLLSAWVAIVTGDHAQAERLLEQARTSISPSVRDFAEVVLARWLLARQQPEAALTKLRSLEGKLVDPNERLIASELRLQAALASGQSSDALLALTSYLSAAPAEFGDRARERAQTAVLSLPAAALEGSLTELDAKARRGSLAPPDVWLRRLLRERLIRLALKQDDARLARRLLDSHPGLASRNEVSAELLQLAAKAATTTEAQGAFVGIALEVGDPDAERRSASVARGLAESLSASLPGADSLPIVVRAADAGHIGDALSELARAGAMALVTGITDASAEGAARWATAGEAPVLLVRDTPELPISERTFVLGTSDLDEMDAIRKELERRRLSPWVRVGGGGFDCRATAEKAGQQRFPIKDWQQQRVEAIAVLGPRLCALELYAETREQRFAPVVALGLESAEAAANLPGKHFALSAGSFPTLRPGIDVPPDFYEALGHDAGRLVRQAWTSLGGAGASKDNLRARLPDALAGVAIQLETTDARGFAGKRRLLRRLTIRETP